MQSCREYHMIITIIWIVTIRLGETRERVLDSSCKVGDYLECPWSFLFNRTDSGKDERGMKKIARQMLTGLLAIAMVLTMGTPAIPKVYAQDNTQVEYEIYPNPHDMSYQEGEYVIRPEVNVVLKRKLMKLHRTE